MKEAMFWEKAEEQRVRCGLCRFRCLIVEGQRGICGVRENRGGVLYTLVYGQSVAENSDPIEKKPLFHFHPGSLSFSVATVGCNFRCLHCQNYQISQVPRDYRQALAGHPLSPQDIVRRARESGCRSIAYTYTEPTIFFEYAYDTAVLAHREGLKNVFVTNGYTTPEALGAIAPFLDAANVDLKGFSEQFYREVVGATLDGVLETLREYHRLGIWLEVTTLLIPGRNDRAGELRKLAAFIADELGADTPWHVTAFYPTYKLMDVPPTPPETLHKARKIGHEAGLRYVYTGNIPGEQGESTFCPGCGDRVIERRGFRLGRMSLEQGRCKACATLIAGVGL
ncbi:pyruvate formate lyase activating enzyme [Geoalkalibacter ferrihydriticus]|uniref:Radical SAM protein n=2 Tax=Geoalkalibacter ferrihydriticus TaxID=392333 RepID=A0A0C2DTP7_9BACT|nr:AmmeMemoRadiSam system radical SAM enzyme [Geoalkalibacter ferrihydriticus]KIH76829.1 radical SAM protein [Geoalkalibacter ferrihydriticus DSM 17813]SDL48861.1 pyruvate formate lyase activating enzyme [Geoalkalibacter ferrihydriticus]